MSEDDVTSLPDGYAHPHASAEAREIAERGTILRAQVGSGLHGTSVDGQDDRDEMGICLEPAEFIIGNKTVPAGLDAEHRIPFEQFQRHTAWDREGGLANRSGAGDLDVVIYSARKWTRLALNGNPTVLLLLFVPESETTIKTSVGAELMANSDRFVSRRAGERFLGYLRSQRSAMLGEKGAHGARNELVEQFGLDTKYAMHALRLAHQGLEFLETGKISLPIEEPSLTDLKAVRRGEIAKDEVVSRIQEAEASLIAKMESPTLPPEPDRAWADQFLIRAYTRFWETGELKEILDICAAWHGPKVDLPGQPSSRNLAFSRCSRSEGQPCLQTDRRKRHIFPLGGTFCFARYCWNFDERNLHHQRFRLRSHQRSEYPLRLRLYDGDERDHKQGFVFYPSSHISK